MIIYCDSSSTQLCLHVTCRQTIVYLAVICNLATQGQTVAAKSSSWCSTPSGYFKLPLCSTKTKNDRREGGKCLLRVTKEVKQDPGDGAALDCYRLRMGEEGGADYYWFSWSGNRSDETLKAVSRTFSGVFRLYCTDTKQCNHKTSQTQHTYDVWAFLLFHVWRAIWETSQSIFRLYRWTSSW